jgi:hypothetical protein
VKSVVGVYRNEKRKRNVPKMMFMMMMAKIKKNNNHPKQEAGQKENVGGNAFSIEHKPKT